MDKLTKRKSNSRPSLVQRYGSDELTVRNFTLRPDTIDEKERAVEAIIATESPVMVVDLARWEPIQEVLLMSGVRLPPSRQVPLLDTHDRSTVKNVLGSCRDMRVEGDQLVGRNVFSKRAASEEAWQLVREGHLKDNSIGYRVISCEQIPPGKSKVIQGRTFTAGKLPLRVTTEWEVKENSICAIGADQLAKTRAEAEPVIKHFIKELRTMQFEEWLKQRGLALDDLTEYQAKALRADYDEQMHRKAAEEIKLNLLKDEDEIKELGRKEELARQAAIRKLAGNQIPQELVQRAIDENWSIDTAKDKFLESLRSSMAMATGSPMIQVRNREVNREALIAAMLLRSGVISDPVTECKFSQETAELGDKLRDMPLYDLCREAIRLDGQVIPLGREEMMSRAFSTVSLPYILGAVANKALLKGYTATPKTWQSWCSIGSVSDFKTNTRVRLTDVGSLTEVTNGGEVAHGTATEEYEQFSIATYAKQFAITRKNIIDDDAGAFTRVPQMMGVKAAQKIDSLVYAHLLANGTMADGTSLFHTNHNNLNTSNTLNFDNLAVALAAFRNQRDADGEPIDVEPKYLIVPPSLEKIARGLVESDLLAYAVSPDASASTDTEYKLPNKNIFRGMMQVVVEPRLENSLYTGYSSTTWYLAADPATCDTIEVAFLNGKTTPTVEQFDASPGTLGIIYRVYIDAGVKALDFRGLQKNTA